MRILVTGAAGFIGFHTSRYLLERGDDVIGIDNLNDYYDVGLKNARLEILNAHSNFKFSQLDIEDNEAVNSLFKSSTPQRIVHLAAQAGVRYSIENPRAYIDTNIVGFLNILEGCRNYKTEHLVYASSSSVYGANTALPFDVQHHVDHPVSLYGATKKSNELMAHAYAHLYRIPVTGLRFFTVYGPWGRPDMAPFIFTRKILAGDAIDVFNHGKHARDFTYIDDIVEGVVRTLDQPAVANPQWRGDAPDPGSSTAPYRVYNIGNNNSVELMYFIECIEKSTGIAAKKNFAPMQAGDVLETFANVDDLTNAVGFKPSTPIEDGIDRLVEWYRDFYQV